MSEELKHLRRDDFAVLPSFQLLAILLDLHESFRHSLSHQHVIQDQSELFEANFPELWRHSRACKRKWTLYDLMLWQPYPTLHVEVSRQGHSSDVGKTKRDDPRGDRSERRRYKKFEEPIAQVCQRSTISWKQEHRQSSLSDLDKTQCKSFFGDERQNATKEKKTDGTACLYTKILTLP